MEPIIPNRKNYTLLIAVVIIVIIILVAGTKFFYKNGSGGLISTISPDILYLTQPVYSFSGKVDKVDNDTLTVSTQAYTNSGLSAVAIPGGSSAQKDQKPKTLTFRIKITNSTSIVRNQILPAIHGEVGATNGQISMPTKLTVKDIQAGNYLSASSNTDLRTLSSNQFDAVSVTMEPVPTSMNGRITDIQGDTLTVQGNASGTLAGLSASSASVTYKVKVTSKTDITSLVAVDPAKAKPSKILLSDLKKDSQVNIQSNNVDLNKTTQFEAVSIQLNQASPVAIPSSQAATSPASLIPAATPGPAIPK